MTTLLPFVFVALAAPAPERVAVLEAEPVVGVDSAMLPLVSDAVREVVLERTRADGTQVLTRESITAILDEMAVCDAVNASCEVETGRALGVDEIVTITIGVVDDQRQLRLKRFEVGTGRLLATHAEWALTDRDLLTAATRVAGKLYDDAPPPPVTLAPTATATGPTPASPTPDDPAPSPPPETAEDAGGFPWIAAGTAGASAALTALAGGATAVLVVDAIRLEQMVFDPSVSAAEREQAVQLSRLDQNLAIGTGVATVVGVVVTGVLAAVTTYLWLDDA